MLLLRESKDDDDVTADVVFMISFWICESTDSVRRSGEFNVHLLDVKAGCADVTDDDEAINEDVSSGVGGVVGVVVKLLPPLLESFDEDCCIRLRYSLMESLRLGCGGGSGAVNWGFKRGSWLAVFVCIFKGAAVAGLLEELGIVPVLAIGGGGRGAGISVLEVSLAVTELTKVVELTTAALEGVVSFILDVLFKPNKAVCDT